MNARDFAKTALLAFLSLTLPLSVNAANTFETFYTADSGCEHPFIDIVDHWSEDAVCRLYNLGVVEGRNERNFYPNDNVTRAEFLKISLLNLGYNVSSSGTDFSDVKSGSWYYRYVTFAESKGFVDGYKDGTFRPNEDISRAEAVVLIMKMARISSVNTSSTTNRFSDVDSDDWFASAVAVAVGNGIVEGYGDGSFRPKSKLSRAEAASMAAKVNESLY
jgi:hypothetical protein